MAREDRSTTTPEDAAAWAHAHAQEADDDRPSMSDLLDTGIGGETPDGELMDAFRTLVWGPIDPQEDPPF